MIIGIQGRCAGCQQNQRGKPPDADQGDEPVDGDRKKGFMREREKIHSVLSGNRLSQFMDIGLLCCHIFDQAAVEKDQDAMGDHQNLIQLGG